MVLCTADVNVNIAQQPNISHFYFLSSTLSLTQSTTNYPSYITILTCMLIKNCVGFFFSILLPIAALCTKEDLRREVVRIYKYKPGVKKMTKEEKEQEIGKEMLKMQ